MAKLTQKLIIRTEDGVGHECVVHAGTAFVIGRDKKADLKLDFKSVSRQHCQLELDAATGMVELVDLGSQNGSRLNGKRVERAALKDQDELLLATVPLKIEIPKATSSIPGGMRLAPAEQKLLDQLSELGLEIVSRVDLGSPIPVYKARRTDLDQDVLVKAVRVGEDEQGNEHAVRLLREAKLAAKMRHRNIVQIYDVRQLPGIVAIIFEWVSGRTLAQEIAKNGRLPTVRALQVGIELCLALEHAHGLGVVHRNITPATVVVSEEGDVKLVDFGLAKSVGQSFGKMPQVTRPGMALGAVEYAPPEQVRDASAVDHRADIYGVGSTLYHALAGEPPLIMIDPARLDDPTGDGPAPISEVAPDVPEAARAVVEHAMRPNPEERYQSAELLRHALEGAVALLESASAVIRKAKTVEIDVARLAASGATGTGTTGFLGRIQSDELVEMLQMVEHNRKSGTLEISGNPDENGRRISGSVLFRDGKIVHARSGDQRGVEALFELVLLPSGNFRVVYGEPTLGVGETEAELQISVTMMEILRRKDELKSGIQQP